jgi:hypothetical protein
VVEDPEYGLGTLHVPPAGEPVKVIGVPLQPCASLVEGIPGVARIEIGKEEEVPVQFAFEPNTVTFPGAVEFVKTTVI